MKFYLILGNTKAGVFDRGGGGKEYPTKGEKGEKNTVRKWYSRSLDCHYKRRASTLGLISDLLGY